MIELRWLIKKDGAKELQYRTFRGVSVSKEDQSSNTFGLVEWSQWKIIPEIPEADRRINKG